MPSLLYPAMQKFYSALKSLESFSKEKNFFENISSLDTFFSEFRNITFVLQKSLAHTEYMAIYEKYRTKYLSDCGWFIKKRNETTKQQPFQLIKQIELTIYLPTQGFKISSMKFTVENDVEISSLIGEFKGLFLKTDPTQVFFSAKFSFYEKGSDLDIYDEIVRGIQTMSDFLNAVRKDTNETCELCKKIEDEIKKSNLLLLPKDMFLITDYVYYPKQDIFDRAMRMAMVMGKEKVTLRRMPLDCFNNGIFKNFGESTFEKFVLMHAIIGSSDLMPTIMIIYKDDTFELDTFHSDIKTTIYRKINETSMRIITDEVQEIYFMITYVCLPPSSHLPNMTSYERMSYTESELLTFMKVDCELNEEEYVFEGEHLSCENYIINQMKNGSKKNLDVGKYNMLPIINAFKQKLEGTK
jgi:hypothetical protein